MSSGRRGAPLRLVEGPITPALFALAGPVFLSRALYTLYGVVDTAWVGRLGPDALAAVSTSFFATWMLLAGGTLFISGTTALVSQAVGARNDDEAARAALTGLVLAALAGTVVAAAGWFGSGALFRLLFDEEPVIALGTQYLSVYCLAAPVLYVTFVIESVYRSCGDSRTPMLVVMAGTLINIILDPLLILGVGPFPRLGVLGAAIATVIGEVVVIVIWAALYFRRSFPLAVEIGRTRESFSRRHARRILHVGAPEALIEVLYSVVYLLIASITGTFGAVTTAALGIVNRLESVTYLTSAALGMGVATLVGQNLGAGAPDRAEASAHRGASLGAWGAGTLSVLFFVIPEALVGLFSSNPDVIREGALFLRIVAVSQVTMGLELIYGHAFVGAGDTLPPMYISVSMSVLRIPLAWWLAFHTDLGPAGIWWTISITGVVRGVLTVWWFRRGNWKEKDLGIGAAPAVAPAVGPEGPE